MNYIIQKAMNRILFTLVIVLSVQFVNAQRLSHVLGEIMFSIPKGTSPAAVDRQLIHFNGGHISASYEQVCAEPMNIWLMRFNHNRINEYELKAYVHELPQVQAAQFNHVTSLREVPNDPAFDQQWQYINTGQDGGVEGADIDMDLAWDTTTGGVTAEGDTIVVCIVDDGFDTGHQDLIDNLWKNHAEIPGNNIDDDGNGYVDDYLGWDVYNNTDNISNDGSHGTPVAGIIGAKGNNELGVAGVNWDVKLMIVRGGSPESNAIASYSYAYTHRKKYNDTNGEEGAFVVATNSSWGVDFGQAEDAPLWCSFYDSLGTQGILSVAATINGNVNVDEQGDLPTTCSSDYIVAVTNLNRNDEKVIGAGYGSEHIDLGAYGAQTYTTALGNSYGAFGGTSAATPHVAGVAALLYSVDCGELASTALSQPSSAALAVKSFILDGVSPLASLEGISTTGGKLNANGAINRALGICSDCAYPIGITVEGATPNSIEISWANVSNATAYNIRIKKSSETEWTELNNVNSPLNIQNLDFCTDYEIQISSICGSSSSEYSFTTYVRTEGCCILPSNINAVYDDSQQITFSWDAYTYASEYQLEYRPQGTSDWTSVNVVDGSYAIPASDCQSLEYRIRSLCGDFNSSSEYSDVQIINTACGVCTADTYCTFMEKDNGGEWIARVKIGALDNSSGADAAAYGNYLGGATTSLSKGNTYDIVLTPGYTGTEYTEYFTVYIDWDLSGTFEDNELVFDPGETVMGPVEGQIQVPTDIGIGQTRMRVIMNYENKIGPCDPGAPTSRFGETEDYCVEIIEAGACSMPLNLVATDSTDTSISINWSPEPEFEAYEIGIRTLGQEEYQKVQVAGESNYTFNGLTICTEYEIMLQPRCNFGLSPGETIIEKTKCTTNTNDLSLNGKVNLINNPGTNNIMLQLKDLNSNEAIVKTYAVNGQLIQELNVPLSGNNQIIDMNSESLNTGLYLVEIQADNQSKTLKMIKL